MRAKGCNGRKRDRRRRSGSGSRKAGHREECSSDRVKRTLGFCLLLCGCLAVLTFFQSVFGPALGAVAEIRVRNMMNRSISQAIAEEFLNSGEEHPLMEVTKTAQGKVTMVQADMAAVNRVTARLTERIQQKVANLGEERVNIPLGALCGSQILSQTGPEVQLRVIPAGTADVAFKTEFETSGVNQTRHRLYLEVKSRARILAPFTMAAVETEQEVLLAETVIVGDTPQSYVIVPEENILDVVP